MRVPGENVRGVMWPSRLKFLCHVTVMVEMHVTTLVEMTSYPQSIHKISTGFSTRYLQIFHRFIHSSIIQWFMWYEWLALTVHTTHNKFMWSWKVEFEYKVNNVISLINAINVLHFYSKAAKDWRTFCIRSSVKYCSIILTMSLFLLMPWTWQ